MDAPGSSLHVAPVLAGAAYPGLFVAFEGGDGAGKSTQARRLEDWLRAHGERVLLTFEPGDGQVGAAIRQIVLHGPAMASRAEALLFAADRAQHVESVVRPALADGTMVLTDRYLDSSIAYQGAGRELGPQEIRDLSLWASGGLLPDLTVLLDVSPQAGQARRGEVHDRVESEAEDFHDRVRAGYLRLAAAEPSRYLVVDAALPPELIHDQVRAGVLTRLEHR